MIQVHPQRAFLNTPIVISNKGTEPVLVQNKVTGEMFALSPGECKTSRYPAGKQELLAKSFSGESQSLVFQVEDALKFGGSKRKGYYIFDGNPWAIIVMKDRTYFLNGDTGEQFVEHNLSPDSIEELNNSYLLFSTGDDVSLFSLKSMSIERTMAGVTLIYNKKNHCVFSGRNGLTVYRFYSSAENDHVLMLECDAYVIQYVEGKEEGVIRYHQKGAPRTIRTLRLLNATNCGQMEREEELKLEDEFVCFPGQHSVLQIVRENENCAPQSVYCMNLYSGRRVNVDIREKPVSEINGLSVWRDKEYEMICNEDVQGAANKYILEVIEDSGFISYIWTTLSTTTTKIVKTNRDGKRIETYKRSTSVISALYDEIGKEYMSASSRLSFNHENNLFSVSDSGEVCIVLNKRIAKIEGSLRFTDFGDPYIVHTIDGVRKHSTLNGEEIPCVEYKQECYASNITRFGLFDQGNERYFWLKTGQTVVGKKIRHSSLGSEPAIVSGGMPDVGPRFFTRTGEILPVPISEEDTVALSSRCGAVLFEKGGLFGIARYSNRKWSIKENLELSIYDSLHVKDAVFCSDGDSFIYQKKNGLVLYDFLTGEETKFNTDKGIQNSVNGYRPYCSKDYYSLPVIVDPVTMRTINNEFLSQYRFSNADGSVYYLRREIRCYLRSDGKLISKEEYDALCKEYNYPQNPFGIVKPEEEKSNKRRQYLDSIGKGLGSGPFWGGPPFDLIVAGFVDYRIVRKEEVAIVCKNGIEIEVPIGPPLYYMNYMAFSSDARRVAIAGKYKDASGLCVIYDMEERRVLHRSTSDKIEGGVGKTKAIWLASFNKDGLVAYYDSTPDTYLVDADGGWKRIGGRSFLTFSPSGKYIAFSRQGYIPLESGSAFWGHVPSCDIDIARVEAPELILCHFNDHGEGIVGTGVRRETVATASFSVDERKILSVSNDGVVVVRNLHLV